MRVLVIEDESKTAAYLQQGLSENGFVVDVCANGDDGLHQASRQKATSLFLDVMLPKRDGWTVLMDLRKREESRRRCCFSRPRHRLRQGEGTRTWRG